MAIISEADKPFERVDVLIEVGPVRDGVCNDLGSKTTSALLLIVRTVYYAVMDMLEPLTMIFTCQRATDCAVSRVEARTS
jgi:hypothetical protein